MKKITKILFIAVSLMILCASFAIGAFAATPNEAAEPTATASGADLYKVVSGTSEKYYADTTSLKTLVSGLSAGSTVYLLRDATLAVNSSNQIVVSTGVTFDLGNHTLTLEQHSKNCGFYIKTTSPVTFKNGNIITKAHSDYTTGRAFSFANISSSGANVIFDEVNFTGSSLMYSYSAPYTITVNGGRHILNSACADMNTSGFIAGQHNITATIKNATIYANGRAILGASSYKAIDASAKPETTFTFEGCKIISTASSNVMGVANEYTKVYFDGCYLLASLSPSLNTQDAQRGVKIADASNIVIKNKTFFSSSSNLKQTTTLSESSSIGEVNEKLNVDGTVYYFDRVADSIKVVWHDELGQIIKSVLVDDSLLTLSDIAPDYTATKEFSNGWYKVCGYVKGGWGDSLGSIAAVDLSKIDPKNITTTVNLYPLADKDALAPDLSVARYNLSTTGTIRNNLYVPAIPDGIKLLGVYVGEREVKGRAILLHENGNAPVYYMMYVVNEVGATEFTKITEVKIRYQVNGVTLEQIYNLSPEKYANYIYTDASKLAGNVYTEEAYNVVADLVRYSYLLSTYANINDTALTSLYNKMRVLCSDLPSDNSLAGSITNALALAGTGSIAYEASSYEPRWRFNLNESAQIVDIKISLLGYHKKTQPDRTNYGTQTYGIENVQRNAAGYITTAYSENIPIYNITATFNITLVKADGTELHGTYGLKSYYSIVAKDTGAADFVKSVFALASSTIAYKFPEGKLQPGDIRDFWECDHSGAQKQETIIRSIYNFAPRFCAKCDSWLFYYEDYGAVADGKTNRTRATHVSGTNDYEAIYWTHTNANEWKLREELSLGKHVAVVGNSNPQKAKNYYISLPEGRGIYTADTNYDGIPDTKYTGENLGSITVATDTSWNGVNLIIDDDAICNAKSCTCKNALGVSRVHAYNSQPIFVLDEYGSENYTANLTSKIPSLAAGATHIGFAPGRKMLINLTDANKKIYLRYGSNASNGASVTEVILVDEFGNIDPSTPVQWDYATVTSANAYAVDTDPIKISGLNNGKINATFESYVNNSLTISIPHYVSCGRNITIRRSNATIEGIERFFTEEPANSNVTNKRFAYTFIVASLCSNATIKDMLVINHNSQSGESGVGQGSYEFSGGNANAVSWINCVTKNMFSDSKAGALQPYPIYRGLFGTNHIRNMYLKDCYLNSFDAHTGAYNVTLEDTTVEHMNFIGGGKITIRDVVVYCSNQGMAFNLRTDYGSMWKGDIDVDGLTIKYASTGSSKPARITILKGSYANQYWGFDTYTPQNVVINDFHIQAYTAVISGGKRVETLGAKDDANMSVYYYYALNTLSAQKVPAESKPGMHGPTDKGDPNITYDYGTNHLEVTKNLTITNSANIIIPTGSAWKNMNVTVDGRIKKWSGGADNGSWS